MATKKQTTHLVVEGTGSWGYIHSSHASEDAALNSATKAVNEHRGQREFSVFQLIAVVKPKTVPVEVVKVSKCKPCTESEA